MINTLATRLAQIDHAETALAAAAERGALAALDGSCRTPIGAYALRTPLGWRLRVAAWREDGSAGWSREDIIALNTISEADALGQRLGAGVRADAGEELHVYT